MSDRSEIDMALLPLQVARERLAKALEVYEDARERGVFTKLAELRSEVDAAWRMKVDAHLAFLEESLTLALRRITETIQKVSNMAALEPAKEDLPQ